MDTQKVYRNLRIITVVCAWAVLAAAPVLADTPPNTPLHVNSAGIQSGELPVPLPDMPRMIGLPAVVFPSVDMSELPVMSDERAAVESLVSNRVSALRGAMTSRYNGARASVAAVRSATQSVSNAIGDPMTLSVHDGQRRVTAVAMAQEMAQSISFSLGYARAVSALGPVGLNLAFLFIGLGWIVVVNILVVVAKLTVLVLIWMRIVFSYGTDLVNLMLKVLHVIVSIFDLFWPL